MPVGYQGYQGRQDIVPSTSEVMAQSCVLYSARKILEIRTPPRSVFQVIFSRKLKYYITITKVVLFERPSSPRSSIDVFFNRFRVLHILLQKIERGTNFEGGCIQVIKALVRGRENITVSGVMSSRLKPIILRCVYSVYIFCCTILNNPLQPCSLPPLMSCVLSGRNTTHRNQLDVGMDGHCVSHGAVRQPSRGSGGENEDDWVADNSHSYDCHLYRACCRDHHQRDYAHNYQGNNGHVLRTMIVTTVVWSCVATAGLVGDREARQIACICAGSRLIRMKP